MTSENIEKKLLRVALIASERTLYEYSKSLEHFLIGLADDSIPAALVCPARFDTDVLVTGPAELLKYPTFELPLAERMNRQILVEQLGKFKPTILHCLCESKAFLTRRLARKLDLPYVLSVNSLEKRVLHFSVSSKRCVKILVPAKTIEASVIKAHPDFTDRIEQINIGTFVSDRQVCFSGTSGVATIVTTHPSNDTVMFENLLGAIKHLRVNGYEIMTVIIGGGRAEKRLWELLRAFDLLRNAIIVPKLEPWRTVIAAGDIFVRSEPSSAFSPLLLEAMGVGAAVAGCKGGVDDLVIEDQTAIVFDPNDEHSIMHALQRLLDRREFARKIALNAQQYVREHYTASKMISKILNVYNQASVLIRQNAEYPEDQE